MLPFMHMISLIWVGHDLVTLKFYAFHCMLTFELGTVKISFQVPAILLALSNNGLKLNRCLHNLTRPVIN